MRLAAASSRARRVAHLGAGRFSRAAHAPMLQRLASRRARRLILAGVADVDTTRPDRARQLCRDFGYRAAYNGIDELLDRTAPDVLVCVVDVSRTAAAAASLLATRIPILLEKPPGQTISDAARLASLSATYGTLHYVAFNRRRVPFVESARRWLRTRRPPRHCGAEMLRSGRTNPRFALVTGIHVVDTLRYLAGEIAWIEAASVKTGAASRDYYASLCFESGSRGDIFLSMDAGLARETYVFEYDDGACAEVTMAAPYSDPSVWAGFRVTRDGRVCHEEPAPADPLVAMGIAGEYETFLDAIETGEQPDCSLLDAWKSMIAADALQNEYCGPIAHGFTAAHARAS